MNKRSIVAVVAASAAAVSLGLAGCSSSPAPSSSGSSAALPVVKMMVGGINKQIYLPYQLAESLGYYKKYGVDMQLSGAWYIHAIDFQSKGKKVINLIQLSGAPGERIMCAPKANVTSGVVQNVVTALTATMHWMSTHTAQDVADKLPKSFVQNTTISQADYVTALKQDYGQFLPDGLMPVGGPKTVFQMENAIGVDTSKITYADTFTNTYVNVALKQLGITPTTSPAGAAG